MGNFKKELKALLVKYSATIEHTYDGDSHGIHNERIIIRDSKGKILARGGIYEGWIDSRSIE